MSDTLLSGSTARGVEIVRLHPDRHWFESCILLRERDSSSSFEPLAHVGFQLHSNPVGPFG